MERIQRLTTLGSRLGSVYLTANGSIQQSFGQPDCNSKTMPKLIGAKGCRSDGKKVDQEGARVRHGMKRTTKGIFNIKEARSEPTTGPSERHTMQKRQKTAVMS